MKSIVEQIFIYAKENPQKEALKDGKDVMTYGELIDRIRIDKIILSKWYHLNANDSLIIAADKQMSFITIYFACHILGVTVLPIAPDTNDKRFQLIYHKVQPKLVIGFDAKGIECQKASLGDFENAAENMVLDNDLVEFPDLSNVADIMFTTGTTGEPKGVQLTQRNLAAAARNINTFIGNKSTDVEMLALPVSHSFGLGRMRCALSNGQTLVLLGSFANMKKFFRFIDEFHVTGYGMVPASWAMIKKLSGLKIKEYASQLRYIEIGSSPMPMEEKRTLTENLPNTRICMHYGLTEASRSAFIEFHEQYDYLDTVGKQSPNMFIEIRDEDGIKVSNGIEGEICVRGEAVFSGYYEMPDENKKSFWGEYFRTGDWGTMDDDGYIRLVSRKKELINVGGKKVSPIEVEEVLAKIEGVKDCVCVGVSDPEKVLGEVVKAYIVADDPSCISFDEVKKKLMHSLEDYKVPMLYEFIDAVPKTSSGKVQRLSLKKS
ncbi:MAG: acyl--CoA ligase [Lachnospiraceae bacterium]|nr:acyl--CoA ligase [Lachnospiraceae bacterium]